MEVNKIYVGDWVKVAETLPSGIAHLIITSPPYWGQRNYGVDGQLGLEKTPEEHIEKLVLGFRELRRVLRDDGVLFLNYGDKYASCKSRYSQREQTIHGKARDNVFIGNKADFYKTGAYKDGDLIGLAWRLALALQADGWYLRSDIIWAKALSFCAKYSGSTMPESVNGWRWERHRVKTGKLLKANFRSERSLDHQAEPNPDKKPVGNKIAQWKPCPGCAKCAPDGLILRKGSWRPTRAHEYLFQLTKTSSYYCDMEAVREELATDPAALKARVEHSAGIVSRGSSTNASWTNGTQAYEPSGRNLRDVFCINPQAYPDSHYATFPEKLVEPCIKVGTSEKGCCPKCGAQWARIVDSKSPGQAIKQYKGKQYNVVTKNVSPTSALRSNGPEFNKFKAENPTTTLGWLPTCTHKEEPGPAVVLDPFCGTATVCAVAAKLGRNYIGIELNPDYVKNQAEYRVAEGETGISKEEQKAGQLALFKDT